MKKTSTLVFTDSLKKYNAVDIVYDTEKVSNTDDLKRLINNYDLSFRDMGVFNPYYKTSKNKIDYLLDYMVDNKFIINWGYNNDLSFVYFLD